MRDVFNFLKLMTKIIGVATLYAVGFIGACLFMLFYWGNQIKQWINE